MQVRHKKLFILLENQCKLSTRLELLIPVQLAPWEELLPQALIHHKNISRYFYLIILILLG